MKEIFYEHLKELIRALKQWERYEKIEKERFLSDEDVQNMVMHGMLRTIQAAIDLGNDIIMIKEFEEPSTYKEIFEILARHNIIDRSLAEELKKLAGFRNVLVHLYYKIDLEEVYRVLRTKRKVLEDYLKTISSIFHNL